ncbi:MAG: CHASE2 domain-containing protein, partial [Cyanobacteriota bacterium]|nr:CHASE2 domain-containing protein [Cyanobacteriota bacterium]
LLAAESPDYSVCPADYALSSQLAIHYLESKGYFLKFPSPSEDRWQFGTKRFEILKPYGGFYQNERDLAGHQILLNYRAGQSFDTIAQQVTLTEVMSDRVDPAAIENRIILLGVTDSTLAKDEFNTPYPRAVRGLILQAHMVSQLLGFVEDGRPLLRFLPLWGEVLFVAIGSIFGGQLAWKSRSLSWRIVFFIAPPILLNVISFIVLLNRGLLLPLIPSILALSATFIIALIFINIETKRLHRNKR